MTQSRLIELSYYDPSAQVRLSAYADTVVLDHNSKGGIISAVRFGGYPEMVRAMSDAIYGGATIEATQNSTTRMLQSNVKGYQRQMSHDGVYAVATLMASDDAQTDDRASEGDGEVEGQEAMQPRKCYIFCPQGDRDRLFEELDHKTAAPLIPAFRDYVLDALQKRGDLRQLEVISLKEKMDAWVLDLKPEDRNVVEVLETGLKNGSIQIPGAIPGAPDGFDGVENVTGYRELVKESKVYPMPQQPTPQNSERQPVSLEQRHAAYSDMLDHLVLLDKHGENLLERGLSEERIRENGYRSMPETERGRRLLADLLRSHGHELCGLPGFRTYYGDWTISGPNGFLIPVRNKDGLIQGLKIRLDDADTPDRKYRWFSSRNMPNGTRSYSWVHVTGDTSRKRAFLTEGPLKGDVASHLANNELFICIGGVNALGGLTDTIRELGVREIVEAMDMDQMTNKNVRDAILTMRKEVKKIPGIRYSKYTWNPAYKGVDDYLLSRVAAM